jgi:DNA polymerase-3 subunit epsilon
MREIVLDTETTGLDPLQGHRVVEIACVELFNHIATGKTWQVYLNPERTMPAEATVVHGLTDAFLADKPVFNHKVDDFLEFIGEAPLVIHNASFDMNFINAELTRIGYKSLPSDRAIDTVAMARRMFPGAPASLDALCKRFGIDTSRRSLHGALLDSRLLADVYLELRGGRQADLAIATAGAVFGTKAAETRTREHREPRIYVVTDTELKAHEALLMHIKDPLWKRV